jgi:hypothetical protein
MSRALCRQPGASVEARGTLNSGIANASTLYHDAGAPGNWRPVNAQGTI